MGLMILFIGLFYSFGSNTANASTCDFSEVKLSLNLGSGIALIPSKEQLEKNTALHCEWLKKEQLRVEILDFELKLDGANLTDSCKQKLHKEIQSSLKKKFSDWFIFYAEGLAEGSSKEIGRATKNRVLTLTSAKSNQWERYEQISIIAKNGPKLSKGFSLKLELDCRSSNSGTQSIGRANDGPRGFSNRGKFDAINKEDSGDLYFRTGGGGGGGTGHTSTPTGGGGGTGHGQ